MNDESSGVSDHIDRLTNMDYGDKYWRNTSTTLTTNRNSQSNRQSVIESSNICRPSTSYENQGRDQRPRIHTGLYTYEARTGFVLRPIVQL